MTDGVGDPAVRTIEVTAVGRASQVPDQVAVALGIEVSRPTVGEALREAAAAVERLVAFLDDGRVPDDRRQTTGQEVQPHWPPDGGNRTGTPPPTSCGWWCRTSTAPDGW